GAGSTAAVLACPASCVKRPRLTGRWRTAGRRPGSDPGAVTVPGRAGAGGADGTALVRNPEPFTQREGEWRGAASRAPTRSRARKKWSPALFTQIWTRPIREH